MLGFGRSGRWDHFIKDLIEFLNKLNVFVGICFFYHFLREFFDVPELIIGDHGEHCTAGLAGGITLIATTIGIASGYLSLLPKVTAVQNQALDPSDPFSTPFVAQTRDPSGSIT